MQHYLFRASSLSKAHRPLRAAQVGQGAGRFPTANSVVSDIVRCAAGSCRGANGLDRASSGAVEFDDDYEAAFFMRVTFENQCGIVKDLGKACEDHGVSIFRCATVLEY